MTVNLPARLKRARHLHDANPEMFIAALAAAETYARRRARLEHPVGTFDSAGRFDLGEPMHKHVRSPSRRYPFSEMLHGRTIGHCAFLHDAAETDTRSIVSLLDALASTGQWSLSTAVASTVARVLGVAPH